jgi:hypothetical protein
MGPVSPGEIAKGPNKKYSPSLAKEMSLNTASFSQEKMTTPAGSLKTMKAKTHCTSRPVIISLKLMYFLSLAEDHARTNKKKRPNRLTNL